ncbi:hypothetical protein KLP28_08530 [Nocardioidaceae bacterium]|nr:hypothetical protein KLP28_08530 [Nocardioidaceae bacterium]
MSDRVPSRTPPRVRVTAPRRGAPSGGGARSRLEDSVPLEEIYVRSLLRAQLRLALRCLGTVALLAVVVPLLFFVRPELAEVSVLGLPLAWVLLGVVSYPVLLGVGWWYLRGAERNEQDFADLVRRGPR